MHYRCTAVLQLFMQSVELNLMLGMLHGPGVMQGPDVTLSDATLQHSEHIFLPYISLIFAPSITTWSNILSDFS